MICSKNAQNLAKNARHSAHHNFSRKCPKCPIFSLFPASSPPKMPTFMPKQKTRIPFFAQNIVKFCIFWAGPDNFWKCPKKGPGPTMVFSASKPFKMPDMGRNAHFWSPSVRRGGSGCTTADLPPPRDSQCDQMLFLRIAQKIAKIARPKNGFLLRTTPVKKFCKLRAWFDKESKVIRGGLAAAILIYSYVIYS